MLSNIDKVAGAKKQESLRTGKATLDLSRRLVQLSQDVPIEFDWEGWKLQPWNGPRLLELCRQCGFRSMSEQIRKADPSISSKTAADPAAPRQRELFSMEDEPAESLLVTEVVTPAGHWSSFPPHKHDVDDPPRETALEETYYHRLRPAAGFGFQRVYSADRTVDESFAVGDGDVVLVPSGYHPVAAGARNDLYYLNVMAGPRREWRVSVDPAFA